MAWVFTFRWASVLYQLNSFGVVFPAACGGFVIPTKAGIRKTRLDSVSSTERRRTREDDTPLLAPGSSIQWWSIG